LNQPGLILVSYGARGVVELDGGERLECLYRRSVGRPCCGDRVSVTHADGESAVVVAIEARRNEFARADARQRKQVIAANLDRVLIVIAPAPQPSRDLVERYLVAVHSLGIEPVLVLNKADLDVTGASEPDGPLGHLDDYRALGYTVLTTSCKAAPGTAELDDALRNRVSILVGQSGVGKSSLVNAVLPDLELQTGALSRVTGKGTHTTTTTIMYALPCGGRLIDSPGVWEYGLWRLEPGELAAGFIEFRGIAAHCRFNDCRHAGEPGCAVADAAAAGEVLPWRYAAYRRLLDQLND
jgi:ribosome biogenesis GTPase